MYTWVVFRPVTKGWLIGGAEQNTTEHNSSTVEVSGSIYRNPATHRRRECAKYIHTYIRVYDISHNTKNSKLLRYIFCILTPHPRTHFMKTFVCTIPPRRNKKCCISMVYDILIPGTAVLQHCCDKRAENRLLGVVGRVLHDQYRLYSTTTTVAIDIPDTFESHRTAGGGSNPVKCKM